MKLIKSGLEKVLGEEKFSKLKETKAYNFGVEAFTMNTFSWVAAAPIELIIAGMDFSEHLKIRLAGVAVNTMTGRPYGIWRDWIFRRMNITEESHWAKKYAGDTIAFTGFQLPLYLLNMTIGGAEPDEMLKSSVSVTLIAGGMGRPYGVYLDEIRNQADLSLEYDLEEEVKLED
jgi:hypothetical protein